MRAKPLPKNILGAVKKKTGKTVTEGQIKKLASNVKASTMQSEAQLRQLIKQVSTMAGVPVSESTMGEIIRAIKSSGGNPASLEQLMKAISKK